MNVNPLRLTSGQALPLRTSNCQALPTEHSTITATPKKTWKPKKPWGNPTNPWIYPQAQDLKSHHSLSWKAPLLPQEMLYKPVFCSFCAVCHLSRGSHPSGVFPPNKFLVWHLLCCVTLWFSLVPNFQDTFPLQSCNTCSGEASSPPAVLEKPFPSALSHSLCQSLALQSLH